jgi:transposase
LPATARERAAVQRPRAAFREAVPELDPKALLLIDESGSHPAMAREYGRAPRGQRAPGAKPLPRRPHVTLVGAFGLVGVGAAMTVEGLVDGAALLAFVQEVLVSQRRPGQVVRDHLKAHQVAGVREAIEAVGARLLSLPPDSPDFSPIEECWSTIKAILRTKAARTLERLQHAITEAFAAITSQDAQGWLTHAGDRLQSS